MGRYYWSKKTEADNLKQIRSTFLKNYGYYEFGSKSGVITWSSNGEVTSRINIYSHISEYDQYLTFSYSITEYTSEEKTDYEYKIPLTTTLCNFGGRRYWFICPWYVNGKYCGRRVGVLFMRGKHFACRHCHDLTYNSRNQTHGGRYSVLSSVLSYEARAEKLKEQIKRPYYAGRPTRKMRKLDGIYRRMRPLEHVLINMELYNK